MDPRAEDAMAKPKLPKLDHKYVHPHEGVYVYRRRIAKDVLPYYQQRGEFSSGFMQRTLGTSDPREVPSVLARVHAEVEAEWSRIRAHLRSINTPQTLDEIDDATAKAMIWKAWLAWQALGFASTQTMEDFGRWALQVMEQLPQTIDFMTPRSVKDWHDSLARQPHCRILTPFARNAIARELPFMAPALRGMTALDLERNPAYARPIRKAKMLDEVMTSWLKSSRRKNHKQVVDKDGRPTLEANKNYDVPFRVMKDVLGKDTIISHVTREDILELVDIICHLPKGAHHRHKQDGTSFRAIAEETKAALENGEDVELNEDTSWNKYLSAITTLFRHAENNNWITTHPANDITILNVQGSLRRALSEDELARLFHAGYVPQVNSWLPLLIAYQGCRTNEIAQLDVADVHQRPSGLWCLSITEIGRTRDSEGQVIELDTGKSMKNPGSRREVPIHKDIVDLGFIDFVTRRHREGCIKLFNVAKSAARFWDSIRDDVTAMLVATGVYKQGQVVPYSLRHTWTDVMTNAMISEEIQEAIGGWKHSGSARKRYGRKVQAKVVRYTPEILAEHLNKLSYPGLFTQPAPDGWNMSIYEKAPKASIATDNR